MQKFHFVLYACAALSLGACQTLDDMQKSVSGIFSSNGSQSAQADTIVTTQASKLCPSVQIMSELKSLTQFTSNGAQTDENMTSTIEIADVASNCEQEDKATAIDLKITFDGKTGPKAGNNNASTANFSYPYFVAVTDSEGSILAKEIFAASLSYSKGQDSIKQIETINQLLPKTAEVGGYNILIGFQLNEEQLQYNREKAATSTTQ